MDFLKGADGCEWVWVMGEHKNDLSIEEIIEQEAQKTALEQAEKEAQALRYGGSSSAAPVVLLGPTVRVVF